ncbi:hypothetical protein BGX24_000663, partial [Mortierella sp. AD032]
HMWSKLKRRLIAYPSYPNSCEEFWRRIAKEWYAIPPEFCQKHICSMHSRFATVHHAKGGSTMY